MAKMYDWTVVRGDDEVRIFRYLDVTQLAVDLTGYTVTCPIRMGVNTFTPEIEVDEEGGEIKVTIGHALSTTLTGNGTFKVVITNDGSGDVKTIVAGTIRTVTL